MNLAPYSFLSSLYVPAETVSKFNLFWVYKRSLHVNASVFSSCLVWKKYHCSFICYASGLWQSLCCLFCFLYVAMERNCSEASSHTLVPLYLWHFCIIASHWLLSLPHRQPHTCFQNLTQTIITWQSKFHNKDVNNKEKCKHDLDDSDISLFFERTAKDWWTGLNGSKNINNTC